jgi:DeoR/GlpR family transcriptional regulator of sugar metabolism
MLTSQRKQLILARLARDGQVIAKDLSAELETSEDTIRRDLRELAQEGRLQRVHGGALPASPADGDMAVRRAVAPADKVALARAAVALIQPGQVVLLDGGTTTTQLARHLPRTLRATVVTHSPGIAVELAEHPALEVIMLGGRLFRHSMVNVGVTTIEAAAAIRADLYFMGVTGVHAEQGLSTGDFEEASVKRALHARAAETVVMASPEKLGAASPFVIASAADMATLIVPASTPQATLDPFIALGVAVLRAA